MLARPEEVRAAVAWLPPSLLWLLRNDALIIRAVLLLLARWCTDGTWSSEDPGRTRQWPASARQPCRSDTRPPHVRCTPPSLCRFPSGLRSSRQGTKRWYALVMAWRRRRSVVGEAEVAPDPSGAHPATRGIGPPLHVVEQGVQLGERATAFGHGLARRATTEGGELLVRPPLLVLAHELVQQHGGLLRWESLGREGRLAGLPVLVASGLRIPSALRQALLHRHDRLRHQLGPWSGGQHPLLQVAEPLDRVGLYGQAAFQAIDRPADHALAVVELVDGEQPVRPLVLELGGEPVPDRLGLGDVVGGGALHQRMAFSVLQHRRRLRAEECGDLLGLVSAVEQQQQCPAP